MNGCHPPVARCAPKRAALAAVLTAGVVAPLTPSLAAGQVPGAEVPAAAAPAAEALTIGETFVLESRVLGEARRINVFIPTIYGAPIDEPLPVLYMPDGGIHEDFLHVAGLVQVLVSNGTMRPFLLVGIENTARRRDLTGPTEDPADRSIAPEVGGSEAFRRFVRTELIPAVTARYPTRAERAIVGESLAGLFVVETFFLEPDLFDTYIAIDPSLWWNGAALVDAAAGHLPRAEATLYLATSGEPELAGLAARLAGGLAGNAEAGSVLLQPMPDESHASIYHPAALRAFRQVLAPAVAEE